MQYRNISFLLALAMASPSLAQDRQELAVTLANPLASLISVPIQKNVDFGLGADGGGWQSRTNVQPVIPVGISDKWNIISRTILPIIAQDGVTAPGADQLGLGDTVQSLFLSPKVVGKSGIIWGAGPVFLLPTATSGALGAGKWGAGPTAVVLKQSGGLTVGVLANHIWSFAGPDNGLDVSNTLLQPFVAYATPKGTSFSLNSETIYDWKRDQWLVPINAVVQQILPLGGQLVQVGVGARYYAESPVGGPDWGMRFQLTFLFPK